MIKSLSPDQKRRHPNHRFKYTIEGCWSLEQFLRSATPKERRQLVRALKDGLIENAYMDPATLLADVR